jgi:hypothetical protein
MFSQSSEGIVVDSGEVEPRMLTVLKHHGDHPERDEGHLEVLAWFAEKYPE